MEIDHVRVDFIAIFRGFRNLLFFWKTVRSDNLLFFFVLEQLNFFYLILALAIVFKDLGKNFGVLNYACILKRAFLVKDPILEHKSELLLLIFFVVELFSHPRQSPAPKILYITRLVYRYF